MESVPRLNKQRLRKVIGHRYQEHAKGRDGSRTVTCDVEPSTLIARSGPGTSTSTWYNTLRSSTSHTNSADGAASWPRSFDDSGVVEKRYDDVPSPSRAKATTAREPWVPEDGTGGALTMGPARHCRLKEGEGDMDVFWRGEAAARVQRQSSPVDQRTRMSDPPAGLMPAAAPASAPGW